MNRLLCLLMAAAGVWSGCSVAGPGGMHTLTQDQPFTLKPGESARLPAAALQVDFDGVTGDSRCPKGERCIRAGDATLRLWVQQGSGARVSRELVHGSGGLVGAPLQAAGFDVVPVQLDPYPVSGRPIAPGDYVLTLRVQRAQATSAPR